MREHVHSPANGGCILDYAGGHQMGCDTGIWADKTGVILILNSRFIPENEDSAYPYGVVGFSILLLKELRHLGRLRGVIVYKRDESVAFASLTATRVLGYPAYRLRFNFRCSELQLKAVVAMAFARAAQGYEPSFCVAYYQTPTLLKFNPPGQPFVVTHHGPFASEVVEHFGYGFACEAFLGGREKLEHLLESQQSGLEVLRHAPWGAALEISEVQCRVLLLKGVHGSRVVRCSPPVAAAPIKNESNRLAKHADPGLTTNNLKRVRLISAAARVDPFKNLRCIVEAANLLSDRAVPVSLEIYAGDDHETALRAELRQLVGAASLEHTIIAPRLAHAAMLNLFVEARSHGIFVCSSRYETFGLTPLEAVLSRLTTVVPDELHRIGVARFISSGFRYTADANGLAEILQGLYLSGRLKEIGAEQHAMACAISAEESFMQRLAVATRIATDGAEGVLRLGLLPSRARDQVRQSIAEATRD